MSAHETTGETRRLADETVAALVDLVGRDNIEVHTVGFDPYADRAELDDLEERWRNAIELELDKARAEVTLAILRLRRVRDSALVRNGFGVSVDQAIARLEKIDDTELEALLPAFDRFMRGES